MFGFDTSARQFRVFGDGRGAGEGAGNVLGGNLDFKRT